MSDDPIVDVGFAVRGVSIPDDHGYALYGAISKVLPELHEAPWLAIHPIRGPRRVDKRIALQRGSRIRLRIPASRIGITLPLSGRHLEVGGADLWVGTPTIEPLVPAASLDAKTVVIRLTRPAKREDGSLDKEALAERVRLHIAKQLDELHVAASVALSGRRQVSVGGRRVLGYSVRLIGLSDEASLAIQRAGIGGKRRMGCGIFTPTVVKQ